MLTASAAPDLLENMIKAQLKDLLLRRMKLHELPIDPTTLVAKPYLIAPTPHQ